MASMSVVKRDGKSEVVMFDKIVSRISKLCYSGYVLTVGSTPPSSPNMRFYGKAEWMDCPLYAYGSAVKSLRHPEKRESKFDLHTYPRPCTQDRPCTVSPRCTGVRSV